MVRKFLTFFYLLFILATVHGFNASAECSKRCKRIKGAEVIGVTSLKQYLQSSRDMITVGNRKVAKRMGYSPFAGCSEQISANNTIARTQGSKRCAPAVLSIRDAVYFCPNQIRPFNSTEKAEENEYDPYTACDTLPALPDPTATPTPTPQVSPIPRTRTFTAEDGMRLTDLDSASVIALSNGMVRAYLAQSDSSLESDTIYFADSADGLTFGARTAITGIGPASGLESISSPSAMQLADGSYTLIYDRVRHVSSAALDIYSLFRAVSANGEAFNNSPDTLLIPTGSSLTGPFRADVVRTHEGTLRMYYETASFKIESALSTDNGATWSEEGSISILGSGTDYAPYPGAASVVQNGDHGYYMFFYSQPSDEIFDTSIFSAESDDGREFRIHDQPLLEPAEGISYLSPAALENNDGSIRLYYLERSGNSVLGTLSRIFKSIISQP